MSRSDAQPRTLGIPARLADDSRWEAVPEILHLDHRSFLGAAGLEIGVGETFADRVSESSAGDIPDDLVTDEDRLLAHDHDRGVNQLQAAQSPFRGGICLLRLRLQSFAANEGTFA